MYVCICIHLLNASLSALQVLFYVSAIIYATAVVGAVVGFGCGFAMLEVYVDVFSPYVSYPEIASLNSDSQL